MNINRALSKRLAIYWCHSSVPKPRSTDGALFFETDSKRLFVHTADQWHEVTADSVGGGGGASAWGDLTGTLADQTDLQSALDAKAPANHDHDGEYEPLGAVAAAIASLLDSAPGALDTLNELAAALGDDANFAATMTNALAGKAAVAHGHAIADVTGLQTALDGKAATGHDHDADYAPLAHGHAIADVTGLQTALDGKAATGHGHAIADVTGLQTALDGKAATGHDHDADYQPLSAVLTGTTASFTTADETKLDGVESGATADQTNSEIETAYNAQVAAASQAEAEAGTEVAIRRWSPLRIAQAIAELAPAGGGGVTMNQVIDTLYPVGALYTSTLSTDPATLLGRGTWARFGEGRVWVGQNGADADFDTAEETGGEKEHTLTESEMPSHTHVQNPHNHVENNNSATTGGLAGWGARDTSTNTSVATGYSTADATAVNQSTGGGQAHNNMPPYIVVYTWKRTA